MKKILLLSVILAISSSCSSTQNVSENWVGKTKQNFVKNWGPAIRTFDDEKKGQILIYADQVYANNNRHNSEMSDSNYWNYTYVYVNPEGKIASLRKEKQVFPPQQINAVDLIGKNAISAK